MNKQVLVVEDNVSLQSFFQKIFEHMGYSLTIVQTLEEIEEATRDTVYDCIFSDIELGNTNTLEFISTICEKNLPIIVISANEQYRDYCLEMGVIAFALKPILTNDLLQLASGNYEIDNPNIYFPSKTTVPTDTSA